VGDGTPEGVAIEVGVGTEVTEGDEVGATVVVGVAVMEGEEMGGDITGVAEGEHPEPNGTITSISIIKAAANNTQGFLVLNCCLLQKCLFQIDAVITGRADRG
jgi:hypothetical protein